MTFKVRSSKTLQLLLYSLGSLILVKSGAMMSEH